MKKLLAILLVLSLMLCSVAFAEAVNPDEIEDTMTSADGSYKRYGRRTAEGQVLQPGYLERREGLCRRA